MDTEVGDPTITKQQVRLCAPKRIKALKFGILSPQDILKQSVVEVHDRHVYDLSAKPPRPVTKGGPLDERLGTSSQNANCATCKRALGTCNGHFGHIKLALPVLHIGYLKKTIDILHCICKECGSILLEDTERHRYLREYAKRTGNLEHKALGKVILADCRKCKYCPKCGTTNGVVRKVPGHALRLVHEKFRTFNQSTSKEKRPPLDKVVFDRSFDAAKKANPEVDKHIRKVVDDLNPLRILTLFSRVTDADCILLGMQGPNARPEMLLWQYIAVPPVAIRPSVAQDTASTEDDLTNKLGDIIQISRAISDMIFKGQPVQSIMEQWDYLQTQVAMYINSEVPNLQQSGFGKPIRAFCQRLKGKQGRFRGNLSGKRVDYSSRTVISPDPNLAIDEVAVPVRVAQNLTYPERVTSQNIESLRHIVKRGPRKHPGALSVFHQKGRRTTILHFMEKTNRLDWFADKLEVGDVVHRHLRDGDIVLFNRQPSLHKLSIMSHRVRVRKFRTFSLNECVCTPYNADFDGDEMNLHVPQTEEARAEANELMNVTQNLVTPKDGTPIIAATQDFVTAAFLLSNKDRFYDRHAFTQICSYMFDGEAIDDAYASNQASGYVKNVFRKIDIPPPAILKPEALWTGKQIFNVLMRPSSKSNVFVNLEASTKSLCSDTEAPKDLDREDGYLVIRNSEIMCGILDKAVLGAGKKDSIFYVLLRDFGTDCAAQAMNRLAKLSARWLTNEGFSIGLYDVYPGEKLTKEKQAAIEVAYAECDQYIEQLRAGKLSRDAGCSMDQTLENKLSQVLNTVRQKAGQLCFQQLSKYNAPVLMARAGSKGSDLNVSQMVATVGQQSISGARVADGFQDRTLPHFAKSARSPPSKGFVSSSFYSGLNPAEFLFHAMSGREGLVDTAVKTAETGYMSRRLMKSLEDLSVQYDNTIRNSSSGIVQFVYGEDGLDPANMEGAAKPVNFERTFIHTQTTSQSREQRGLLPEEIVEETQKFLQPYRDKCQRQSLQGHVMEYAVDHNKYSEGIDQYESRRQFYDTLEAFMTEKAQRLTAMREHFPLPSNTRTKAGRARSSGKAAPVPPTDKILKISKTNLDLFLSSCLAKYNSSRVQPGHAVGAVGAQSIGEPGTQMTLKTFHFAGIAGMSITQGVPRIKEIINGSRIISTPMIVCQLNDPESEESARVVQCLIQKTHLKDIMLKLEEIWTPDYALLRIELNLHSLRVLRLNLTTKEIATIIAKARPLGLRPDQVFGMGDNVITIYPERPLFFGPEKTRKPRSRKGKEGEAEIVLPKPEPKTQSAEQMYFRMQVLKRNIPNVQISGLTDISRTIVAKKSKRGKQKQEDEKSQDNEVVVEGYGFKQCLNIRGVDYTRSSTNNVDEVNRTLGIEAARKAIINELYTTMGEQMEIDPRHLQLLADVMTFKGDVLGITRFGMAKMRDSVLQLASFEKTPDHLFEAAFQGQVDPIEGVSENIIMGQSMRVGTGAANVVKYSKLEEGDLVRKQTIFEDACCTSGRRGR